MKTTKNRKKKSTKRQLAKQYTVIKTNPYGDPVKVIGVLGAAGLTRMMAADKYREISSPRGWTGIFKLTEDGDILAVPVIAGPDYSVEWLKELEDLDG